jgi:hypothetical protein
LKIIHKKQKALAVEKIAGYAALRLCIQLRTPATIEPTMKNVAIA